MKPETSLPRSKRYARLILGMALGSRSRLHRIPFGPLRGRKLFMSPQISPRMWIGSGEPFVTRLFERHIQHDSVVYDIGAHIGYTTVLAARFLEGTGAVHAFEILPSTSAMLRKTVDANGLKNVTIHTVGLGAADATHELPIGRTAMTSLFAERHDGEACERCAVVTLDGYRREHRLPAPHVVKIDVEGAEVDCLQGARQLIDECRPTMIIEFHSKELLAQGFALLTSLGYRLHDDRGPVTESSIGNADTYYGSVLCRPEEVA